MGAFNGYISSKSYVEGYAYSQVRPSIEEEQGIRASCCRCAIAVCPTLRVMDRSLLQVTSMAVLFSECWVMNNILLCDMLGAEKRHVWLLERHVTGNCVVWHSRVMLIDGVDNRAAGGILWFTTL